MANLSLSRFITKITLPDGVYNVFENAKDSLNGTNQKATTTVIEVTDKTFKTVAEAANNTKNSLIETASHAVNTVTAITDKTNNSWAEATSQTAKVVTDLTDTTLSTLAETAQKTKVSVAETAGNVVNSVNEATNHLVSTIGETGENGKVFLGDTVQTAGNLGNSISTKIEDAINAVINHKMDAVKVWIDAHPALSWITKALLWGINHPIFSLVFVILAIFSLRQFIKGLGSLVEQALLSVVKAPFKLGQFLLGLRANPLGKSNEKDFKNKQREDKALGFNPSIPGSISHEHRERLSKILMRIEALRQEQNELLQEVAAILALDDLKAE